MNKTERYNIHGEPRFSRRQAIAGGLGLAGIFILGCSEEKDEVWPRIISKNFPYSVEYPPGWSALPLSTAQGELFDMFTPDPSKATFNNISINSGPKPKDYNIREDVNSTIINMGEYWKYTFGFNVTVARVSDAGDHDPDGLNRVGGMHDAYRLKTTGSGFEENTVMFETDKSIWFAQMSTGRAKTSQVSPIFKRMLSSFKLIE